MNILLVDDERQFVEAIAVILKQHKYSVDCAFDGEQGLDYINSGIYDLIILDVMMPRIDGFSLLKIIRQKKIDVPVLMLSAKSEISDKIEGLKFWHERVRSQWSHHENKLTVFILRCEYYYPYLMLIHVLSLIFFDNIYEMMKLKYYYSIFLFIFVLLIPILINIRNNENDHKNITQYT